MAIIKKTYTKYTYLVDAFFKGEITLDEVKYKRIIDLKKDTYNYVITYMPEWRQSKWDKYIGLYEKKAGGITLSAYERGFYDSFPDSGETHLECYQNALQAMNWIMMCTIAHEVKEVEVIGAVSISEITSVSEPDYPGWVL